MWAPRSWLILDWPLGKRNDAEDAKEKLFTYATHVAGVTNFKVGMILCAPSRSLPCLIGFGEYRRRPRVNRPRIRPASFILLRAVPKHLVTIVSPCISAIFQQFISPRQQCDE